MYVVPDLRRAARRLTGLAPAAVPGIAAADYEVNLPPPVTSIAGQILQLHNLIFVICVAIFVVVFGFMLYSLLVHRKSRGYKPAAFHDNVKLEALWTVIPFLILVGMAIPSTATLIEMSDVTRSDMTVKITGYQWKWRYDYPEQEVGFFSTLSTPRAQIEGRADKGEDYLLDVDNPLVLPVGKKVRLLFTANDVIHAWWVPQLGVKKDAIPGFINESWVSVNAPGIYRGQCAELCGKDHAFMPVVVRAVTQEEFDAWVAAQKQERAAAAAGADRTWTQEELMARGAKVYRACAACHGPNGEGVGAFPALAGSPVATGAVEEHLDVVIHGVPGTAMQAYGEQLSDADIAAVVTFERNSFGNDTGDGVQPAQVEAAH